MQNKNSKQHQVRMLNVDNLCRQSQKLAVRGRLERPTYGLEGSCSIRLSYRTVF